MEIGFSTSIIIKLLLLVFKLMEDFWWYASWEIKTRWHSAIYRVPCYELYTYRHDINESIRCHTCATVCSLNVTEHIYCFLRKFISYRLIKPLLFYIITYILVSSSSYMNLLIWLQAYYIFHNNAYIFYFGLEYYVHFFADASGNSVTKCFTVSNV